MSSTHLPAQVLDDQRNAAYEAAIRCAVEAKRASGHVVVTALDIGAGSGLLSMMAARYVQHGALSLPQSIWHKTVQTM